MSAHFHNDDSGKTRVPGGLLADQFSPRRGDDL